MDIERQLQKQGDNSKFGDLHNAVQRSLKVGESLGIISLNNETIKAAFDFRALGRNARVVPDGLNFNSMSTSFAGCSSYARSRSRSRSVNRPIRSRSKKKQTTRSFRTPKYTKRRRRIADI